MRRSTLITVLSQTGTRALRRALAVGVGVGGQPASGGDSVAVESLEVREHARVLDHALGGRRIIHAHPRAHAQERHHAEPPRRACGAASRQRVVRSGAIISEDLGGAGAYEESSVVLEAPLERHRLRHVNLEMRPTCK